MRNVLISYLLGELSLDEHRRVEEQLAQSPAMRRELERLRKCMESGQNPDCSVTPSGLAERTAQRVSGVASGEEDLESVMSSPTLDAPSGAPSWSLADLITAAGVIMAVGMLLVPGLGESRERARRHVCEDNLRQVGVLLTTYSYQNGHYYPRVAPQENAGVFTVRLVQKGLADDKELARLLVCPSTSLAGQIASGHVTIWIPSESQLRSLQGPALAEAQQRMGGSYAYRIGYVHNGRYNDIRNQSNAYAPLLADAPSLDPNDDFKSRNHRGLGQNVLFQDLRVRYVVDTLAPDQQDHLYLNDENLPIAGRRPDDTVLSRSEATPGVRSVDLLKAGN
jgi:hypothetical protein